MDPKIKKDWVAALRSGDFLQGRGTLHNVVAGQHQFCCLGVLCELAIADGGVNVDRSELRVNDDQYAYNGNTTSLPVDVVRWAGVNASDPVVNGRPLSRWNDGDVGHEGTGTSSFVEIADAIEEHL